MRRTNHIDRVRQVSRVIGVLLTGTLLLSALLSAAGCSRARDPDSKEAEESRIISFEDILPDDSRKDQSQQGRKDQVPPGQEQPADAEADGRPHDLFYLNGVWSSTGAYDDDLYYDYDEIEEVSLVFENGWVAFTAGDETRIYPVEQENGNLFFSIQDSAEDTDSSARVYIYYHNIGYYLELVPGNDPSFRILFERQ